MNVNRRLKWLFVPAVVVLMSIGTSAVWSEGLSGDVVSADGTAATKLEVADSGSSAPGGLQLSPDPGPEPYDPKRVRVLVHMDPVLELTAAERVEVRAFAQDVGGFVKYEYLTVLPNVLSLRDVPEADLDALEQLPGVIRVEEDEYHPNLINLHDSTPLIRGLESQITGAGYSADGAGVRICICDTGIDSDHLMYSDRIDASAGYDFYNDDSNPEDDNGHGSHVAGIAAGGTGLSVDFGCGAGSQVFEGVAHAATLIGVKILNSAGGGYDSDIIAGINYCGDQSPSGAQADVINLSIGTGNYSGPCTHSWAVAANNAVANGVVVVAASGNSNYSNAMNSPACGADVIAVGATWKADYPTCEDPTTNWYWTNCTDYGPQTDDVVCFSNESDYLDVTAPGANIWSASNASGGGSIVGMAGTSMACPHVVGLAALILSADPSLTPAEVRTIIRDGAIDLGSAGFDRAYGYGRIDVLNSLALVGGGECDYDWECDDGEYCNGAETCVDHVCQDGTAVDCNDGVACTDDSCNEGTDSCDNMPNDANCDNGLYCDGDETCHATLGCQDGTDVDCNDGVACTDDSCNEGTDSCDNVPNDANCDNGQYCDGDETCHATLGCQSGTAVDCDDGVGCTDDSCNEGTDSCDNVANDANCDNGLYCDGAETCHATLDCQGGTYPCPGQLCDEDTNSCYDCQTNDDCDDDVYCNGQETCSGGTCYDGTAVDCNDGVACTDDSCNEGTDSCDNVPNDANCDNGLYCDGDETCHATLDCQSGTAIDCNDGVGCTDDSCNEGTDSCDNVANDAYCDNGLYCDGDETCHATLDCQSGTAVDCNDGVGCTDDSCNEGTDSCDNVTNDANCPDDGLYCNGTESCNAVLDCVSSGDPCEPGQSCNEDTDTCEDVECVIDDDCDDGSDCTTDTCVDGVCYNECASTVSLYPYTEGFESGWEDWGNASGDDMDWTRRSGSTPSSNTGPSGAHGGTYYIYTESSSPNYPNKTAILEGPCFDLTGAGDAELTFWYHMYGSAMGTLNVEVSEDCISWTNVWSLSGNQGNAWYEANVDLTAYAGSMIVIRFRGVTGTSYTSDMSVDDIVVDATPAVPCDGDEDCDDGLYCNGAEVCVDHLCQPGSDPCPGQGCDEVNDVCTACDSDDDCDDGNDCTVDTCVDGVCYNECVSTVSSYPYAEGFESGWGDWVNVSGDDMDWTRRSGSTPSSSTGPSGAHGGSYYVYTESSSPNYPNKTAILEGPCFDFGGATDAALTFWYHMYGSAMGTLNVEVSEDCISWTNVWNLSGDQGNAWYEANVDLSAYTGTIVIRFRGVTGSSYRSDMAVDDISVTATAGPECDYDWECDDGAYCNGAETCVDHVCQDGTPVNCGDGVGCTDDSCNEGTDSCDNVPNDANCDNGLYCDGDETCHPTLDCQSGTTVDCDDAVDCTDDSCNEGTDSCDNVPNDAYCDNGVYCDGAETCHATLDCQSGTAVDCDDGVGCTDDSCNEGTDSCDNVANDAYCPDDGLYCNGTEYCDAVADCTHTGDPCDAGEVCHEDTDTCEPGDDAKMEAGSVTVGGTPVTISLSNTYTSPVVVCSIQYDNNSTPVVTRVTNVTSTSFDLYLQNPSGGGVASENVSCIVVEEGVWTIDGVNIEAQTYLSTVTDENNSWVGEAQTYGQTYTNPVVIGQVMSVNDPLWSVFWCQGSARTNPPSSSALKTGKTVCEDTVVARQNETIGFIVFEASHGTIGGVEFEALLGADTVQGVTNSPPYTYTFSTPFASAPTAAITTMAGVDGGNGGWSYTYGPTMATTTTLYLAIDEDQIADSERNHVNEQVGYIVFGSAMVYP